MKIEELHKILYDILCEIEKACQKEHVQYMLGGGTMLGAVRHKGFIPWDDDAFRRKRVSLLQRSTSAERI